MKIGLGVIVFLLIASLFFVPAGAQSSNKSITIGGHTFTAKLTDNWTANQDNVGTYDPKNYYNASRAREMEIEPKIQFTDPNPVPIRAIDWMGTQAFTAFSYNTRQSPESIKTYGLTKYGFIDIRVLKLTKAYLEAYSASPNETLDHAIGLGWDREIHKVFDGRLAVENIGKGGFGAGHIANVAVLLDKDTIAKIDIATKDIDLDTWEIIDNMKID